METTRECPLVRAVPALAWPRALHALEKVLGFSLAPPWVDMTFGQDCEDPHPRNSRQQGGPELTVSWEKLSNDSISRMKPEATSDYFFTLEMKRNMISLIYLIT